jgi:streptogramin lyase/predicted Ser/Thr protein kinase
MAVCSFCGAEVGDGAVACGGCGRALDETRVEPAFIASRESALAMTEPRTAGVVVEPSIAAGEHFAGYLVEGIAGQGGMGVVYRARDEQLGRAVALKVIAPALARDEAFRERFKRESRLAAQIDHPNVVAVYRAGEEAGQLFIAMRFVDGVDLATMLAERGRLAPDAAANLVAQVARGLDAAHARGLVHRDVKPANVLVTGAEGDERAYLTDFGLSIEHGTQGAMTRTGQWVGTVAYIAPEQIRGAGVDARADVYALAGLLYHCLAGEVPFPAEHELDALSAHLSRPPPRPSAQAAGVPAALDRVVGRGMSKDPAQRFPSAGDLGRAAVAASRGERPPPAQGSVAAGRAAPQAVPRQRPRRVRLPRGRRAVLAACAVSAAAAGAGAILLLVADGGHGTPRRATAGRAIAPIGVEVSPDHVAVLGGRLWSVTADVGRLQRVDPRTRRVDVFPPAVDLGGGAYADIAAGAGAIWVAHDVDEGGIDRVDPATGEGTEHVSLPNASAVVAGRDAIWATFGDADRATRNLTRIDPRTVRTSGARLDAGRDPAALALGDGSLWVVNGAPGTLTRIDSATGRARPAIPVGRRPDAVAVGPRAVWVLNSGDDTLTRVDPATDQPVDVPLSLGKQLEDIALAGGVLWVAAADRTVSRLDPVTGAVRAPPVAVGRPPLALAADGTTVWVASGADRTVRRLEATEH